MAASSSNMEVSNIYQFKITLKRSRPKIWRRIQVPAEYSFWDLHVAIQDAMGWQDCHLHKFEMINPETGEEVLIGIPDDTGFFQTIPGKIAKIATYFLSSKDKAKYEYDFGDGWEHEVILEDILPAVTGMQYPKCVAGKLACPPEDCGGVGGYEYLLEVIANPQHEDYAERMEWLGGNFNPKNFDPKLVKFDDPKERPML